MINDILDSGEAVSNPGSGFQKSFWTVTRKVIGLIVVATTIVFVVFIGMSGSFLKNSMLGMAEKEHKTLTTQLADTVSGAVRWKKLKQVESTFQKVAAENHSPLFALSVVGIGEKYKEIDAVFSKDGNVDVGLIEAVSALHKSSNDDSRIGKYKQYLLISAPVIAKKDSPAIGRLVTVWDNSSIVSEVSDALWEFYLYGALAIALLSVVLGVTISRGVGRRIALGVNVAKQIARGNLDNDIKISAHDELGELAQALIRPTLTRQDLCPNFYRDARRFF